MSVPVLSEEDIQQFIDWGFVSLPQAFPSSIAEECRRIIDQQLSCHKVFIDDPSSWPKRLGLTDVFVESDGFPWNQVFTPRLRHAVDELCGKNRWDMFGCGWWVVSFPSSSPSMDFEVEGHWHIDGNSYIHFPHSKEIGLVMIMLFSDILPNGGGTSVACGSHNEVSRLIIKSGIHGVYSKDIVPQIPFEFEVVELTGYSGDVILMHPHLLHARSKNNGLLGSSSIRYICHPAVPLKQPMSFSKPLAEMSVVEKCIYDVAKTHELHLVTPEECHRAPENQSVSLPLEMEQVLGISNFGKNKRYRTQ